MNKFRRSIYGYNADDVNIFLDNTIRHVDDIIREENHLRQEIANRDAKIAELERTLKSYKLYETEVDTSITDASDAAEYIKSIAKSERDAIILEARKNANRIISDALLRAEKTEYEAQTLKKNIDLYKSRVRTMLNQQMDLIDDLDDINDIK